VITGAHAIIFTPEAERIRAFLGDVLGLPAVDAGGGWPIFGVAEAEIAAHPTDGIPHHELYLICDDIRATVAELEAKGVELAEPVREERWGLVTRLRLPDGGGLALYEPTHARPPAPGGA
jgi:catechol 2,3-dioxygenase-like lactoylglutathione lyase family enzyme